MKRFLQLLCALAFCLALTPATALAADTPATLWVGGTQITTSGYWTTDANGKLTTGDETNYNVHYDGNGTLTLNNANIQGEDKISRQDPQDYGIYASSATGQPVALTINLIGTNTVKGVGGIYITSDGNSVLVIQSDSDASKGSLEVSGSATTGIYIVVSGYSSGNPSLTINNASVEASTKKAGYYGVSIVSYATRIDPTLSLTVNGGSLTAQSGIRYVAVSGTNSSASLTVENSALIKSTPNISTSGPSKPTPQGDGIVFDGSTGTVYGDVTLDESLTVNEGETLTIPEDSTLDTNGKLTNDGTVTVQNGGTITDADTIANTGTINVENGGNLNGTPTGGTVVHAPGITTESLPNGTVGQYYSQTLLADGGGTITWGLADGSLLPDGLTLNESTGVITGTPTAAGNFTFTITAKNSAGEASKEYTLTIAAVPVANVTLDHTVLALFPGDTTALTAKVDPDTATDKTVTWESSDPNVATVDQSGKVTAVAPGTATITATAGGKTATCTVTVTDRTYTVSVNPTSLEFDTICPGDARPAAKTVTITNTGNQTVEVTLPAAPGYTITGGNEFTGNTASIEPEGTATFTVQPNDLTAGNHSETLTISWNNGIPLPVGFTVGHELTGVAAKAPTCTEDGYEAYWKCERCGRYFSDADGKTPIPAPTVIKATGHQWGEPAWTWDGTTATATFTCKNDASHTQTVTATVTSTVKTDPTCTENGVTEYTATVEHDGTTYTATKNVADIPATGHDWGEDGHCTICDAVKPGFTPEIIQGDKATWTKGGGQPLSFTSNAAYADFQEARVDGQPLDPVHYTVEQGSTIVTLKAAYLESLDPGEHTLDIVSSTGTATATFTITAKETQQPAKPADTDRTPAKPAGSGGQLSRGGSDIMPAVATLAILMASGLVLGTFVLRRGRR